MLAAAAVVTSARAQTPAVTLKLRHLLPPPSPMVTPRCSFNGPKTIETESQGRIKIGLFPAMQLGGTWPQLYDQTRDGVIDIVWTLQEAYPLLHDSWRFGLYTPAGTPERLPARSRASDWVANCGACAAPNRATERPPKPMARMPSALRTGCGAGLSSALKMSAGEKLLRNLVDRAF